MTRKSRGWGLAVAVLIAGCAGANPFVARFINENLSGVAQGGGQTSRPTTTVNDTCDLAANRKVITMRIQNCSRQRVAYSLTFVASSGSGGWVCDDDRATYINFGYRPLPLDPITRTATIGCDPVPLLGGSELLALRVTGSIAADTTNCTEATAPVAASPLNGTVTIPVPELIVLGDNQAAFICQGVNACTQGGFVFTDLLGNPIGNGKVTASRTQGTICNVRVGNLPEWRLFDPNFADTQANAFQYTAGSIISVTVLDRADNQDPNTNQVVWRVVGVNGDLIHDFQP